MNSSCTEEDWQWRGLSSGVLPVFTGQRTISGRTSYGIINSRDTHITQTQMPSHLILRLASAEEAEALLIQLGASATQNIPKRKRWGFTGLWDARLRFLSPLFSVWHTFTSCRYVADWDLLTARQSIWDHCVMWVGLCPDPYCHTEKEQWGLGQSQSCTE